MSKEIFEDGTVETALAQASDKLGVEVSQLEHVIISEKRDFWGAGEDTVTIEAWVRPEQHEEFAEPETKSAAQPKNLAGEDDDAEAPKAIAASGEFQNSDRAEVSEATEEEPPPDSGEAVSAEHGSSINVAHPEEDGGAGARPVEEYRTQDPKAPVVEQSEIGPDAISNLLEQIFHDMEFSCTVEIEPQPDGFLATISGDDKEVFLESNGRSLSALELLTNNAFRHKLPRGNKIRVDAGDFRSQRDEELSDLAFQVAHSAKESGRTQETQPLNPYERRLVHLALAEDGAVTTRSRGSGFLKNVQVIPQDNARGSRGGAQNRPRRG